MKLSVIIPVYNEINTIQKVISKVIDSVTAIPTEIILVDDYSSDGTREWLRDNITQQNFPNFPLENIQVIYHQKNQGKGCALRTGFQFVTGDVIIIQDADLEYDPRDWQEMWDLIVNQECADIVYGSRFYGKPHRVLYFYHLLGNKVISNLINLLCNTTLSDIEVCYKMFRKEVLDDLKLTCNDFGFEVEFTIKVTKSKRNWRIYETGVRYYGRTYAEGKKIDWKDGMKALWYILKYWMIS
jgi:glycosyltransferase involved in cell wall biosynthesis